ncbi:MAG: glycosyltransferase [Ilumatobacteraceae bacterium]|nr:glycosyltransferase [Ilumatobacteraceae bacterium]
MTKVLGQQERPHVAMAIQGLHGTSGGAERVFVDVANGLHRRGFRVTVLTYQALNGTPFYPLDYGIARFDGRPRHAAGSGRSLADPLAGVSRRHRAVAVATWLATYAPKVLRYRRLLRLARPDLAIGFLPSTFPYLTLAATGSGVKTIASLHNVPDRDLGGDPERWDQNPVDIAMRRRSLATADATTVLLPSFVEQLPPDVRAKASVIPNMIHPYGGEPADVSDDDDDNTILAVGRLAPAKDHATLLRAWALLEPSNPRWRLRIIGTGPLRADLESLIVDRQLERVTIDEPTAHIEDAYTSSKFVAMSSSYEGFGLVTAEAMACGVPVVGFADCEGTNEIVIDGENGLLVDPGTDRVEAFATAMQRLIDDEPERRRLARQAPSTVAGFRPDAIIDAWEDLLLRVHRGRPGR